MSKTNSDITSINSFEQLGLIFPLQARLKELAYKQPTPIQVKAIPLVIEGHDIIAGANTGSGKTASFVLPLLQRCYAERNKQLAKKTTLKNDARDQGNFISGLILVPTRELAKQVSDSLSSYAAHLNGAIKSMAVFGGVSVNKQMLALRGGKDILVATPGRLIDLISSNAVNLARVHTLVLDEADRMLSLGFCEELDQLLSLLPRKKQTILFSATFPEQVTELTKKILINPVEIQLQNPDTSTLVQRVFEVNKGEKTAVLAHLIVQHQWRQVLVFVNAKNHCEHLAQKLARRGIAAEVFHGDKGQSERGGVMEGLKAGAINILIATDIAARGLDIARLPVVINFNLPRSPADYMHRIGRSGRAGEVGLAISLIDIDDYHHFHVIEKKNKLWLEREQVIGFKVEKEMTKQLSKPVAKPEGTGKKKRHKKNSINADIWLQRNN